jgi:hypothetical protein
MRQLSLLSLTLSGAVIIFSACDSPETAPPERTAVAEAPAEGVPGSTNSNGIRVGAKLYDQRGELWGTIVEVRDAFAFPNGVTEPAVKVDYGPRMGDSPVEPQWLPRRSAERFRIE